MLNRLLLNYFNTKIYFLNNITFKFIQGERLEKVYVGVYNQYDYKIAKQLMASVTVPVYITNDMNVLHDGF